MSFAGLRVLSLETRRAAEIDTLIRKQGGEPFVAPSVQECPLSDHSDAFRLVEAIEAGGFDLVIFMTGVGLSFWRDVVKPERADAALRQVKILARGPKPGAVLRSAGLRPDITIPEPNTWREVVEAVRARTERKLAVQEYGRANSHMVEALQQIGARVETFALYRWQLPEDTGPLRNAVRLLASGGTDVVLFTSGVQLEHLMFIAAEEHLSDQVLNALSKDVVVASIGPIMTETLIEHGLEPDIVPESPKMGALVYAAAEQAPGLVQTKRAAS